MAVVELDEFDQAQEVAEREPDVTSLEGLPSPAHAALTQAKLITRERLEIASSRLQIVRHCFENYDPHDPHEAHLRTHQHSDVNALIRSALEQTDEDYMAGTGFAMISPTGSGKTVVTTALARIFSGAEISEDQQELRVLVEVPRLKIREQTLGSNDTRLRGILGFAPQLDAGPYRAGRRRAPNNVTIMLYQSLPGAILRGDFAKLDPDIVICDEAHHVIEGRWATLIREVRKGRVLIGMTATPRFSDKKQLSRSFPETVVHRTMREGIEQGILSDAAVYLYQGDTKLNFKKGSRAGDYKDEEMLDAFLDSPDNYRAAKIAAEEVAQGRSGFIFCVKGGGCAHAKVMAAILNETPVPGLNRNIRAAWISGDDTDEANAAFEAHDRGEIDVICSVDMIGEGYDPAKGYFGVFIRPTASELLEEQRIGRLMRLLEGKIASLHEFLYEMRNGLPQVTAMQILKIDNKERYVQGMGVKPKKSDDEFATPEVKVRPRRIIDVSDFKPSQLILEELASLENVPMEELKIMSGHEGIPFDWMSAERLAAILGIKMEEVTSMLETHKLPARSNDDPEKPEMFYPPRAETELAEQLGIKPMPEDRISNAELYAYLTRRWRSVKRRDLQKALEREGFESDRHIDDRGRVVTTYSTGAKEVWPYDEDLDAPMKPRVSRSGGYGPANVSKEEERRILAAPPKPEALQEIHAWLEAILVPQDGLTGEKLNIIQIAQASLLGVLKLNGDVRPPDNFIEVANQLIGEGLLPTHQMKAVMQKRGITLAELLFVGREAFRSRGNDVRFRANQPKPVKVDETAAEPAKPAKKVAKKATKKVAKKAAAKANA